MELSSSFHSLFPTNKLKVVVRGSKAINLPSFPLAAWTHHCRMGRVSPEECASKKVKGLFNLLCIRLAQCQSTWMLNKCDLMMI